jgi:hypothetical protein
MIVIFPRGDLRAGRRVACPACHGSGLQLAAGPG